LHDAWAPEHSNFQSFWTYMVTITQHVANSCSLFALSRSRESLNQSWLSFNATKTSLRFLAAGGCSLFPAPVSHWSATL
jgi:hypothetical protein